MSLSQIFPLVPLTDLELSSLAPIFVLLLAAIGCLLSSAFAGRFKHLMSSGIFVAGILACIAIMLLGDRGTNVQILNGVFISDMFSKMFAILILFGALGSGLMSMGYLEREHIVSEYFSLLLLSVMGGFLLVSTSDLMVVFIGLELLSLATYVLVGINRDSSNGAEASLKYFIMGGVASAVFLYGVSLFYGATGSLNVVQIHRVITESYNGQMPLLVQIAAGMVSGGLLFKLGIVPFQVWVPDVYSGASSPVTGYMITAVKVASFGFLMRIGGSLLGIDGLVSSGSILYKFLWVAAAFSMLLGSLVGLMQTQLKRLMAYSTISHSGYVLMGFLAFGSSKSHEIFGFMFTYLVFYTIVNLGVFAVLTMLKSKNHRGTQLSDLSGLFRRRPWLALALTVFLLSLAGIPPTAGFIGKFQLFYGVAKGGELALALVAVLSSMISLYFYLRPIAYMYMREGPNHEMDSSSNYLLGAVLVVALALLLTFYFGFSPTLFKGPF
jgi:NADH-quinone oxidoreductase subunit N